MLRQKKLLWNLLDSVNTDRETGIFDMKVFYYDDILPLSVDILVGYSDLDWKELRKQCLLAASALTTALPKHSVANYLNRANIQVTYDPCNDGPAVIYPTISKLWQLPWGICAIAISTPVSKKKTLAERVARCHNIECRKLFISKTDRLSKYCTKSCRDRQFYLLSLELHK